jgi:PKD repeat protein
MINRWWRVAIAVILLLLLISSASAWLSGFQYKKEHLINYTGDSTLNNYQMRFIFWNTTGVDTGENCYLGSHVTQQDWDDLRVTTTTDGICDIWIQQKNENCSIVWVEVPYVYPGNDTRLFIYYGKPVATSVSDGDATFRVWGTFEQIPLNVEKWSYSGNYTQFTDTSGNTLLEVVRNNTSGNSRVYSLDTFSYATGYELIGKVNLNRTETNYFGFISTNRHALFYSNETLNNMYYTSSKNVASPTVTNLSSGYTGWQIFRIQREPNGNDVRFLVNNTYVANHSSDIPTLAMPLEIASTVINATAWVDWVFVKKYVEPEPTHGLWEGETVETAPNARFEGEPRWGYDNLTVYFTDISTGVVTTWEWDVDNDGVVDYTTKNCNHTYTSAGLYDVSLTVNNTNGTSVQHEPQYINVMSLPTPTPTPTTCPACNSIVDDVDTAARGSTSMLGILILVSIVIGGLSSLMAFLKN